MKHVWIAIPAYTGQIHIGTMRSIISDMLAFRDRGDNISIHDDCGNPEIAGSRANIVAEFLESDGTHLVFVDHDVIWEAGALLRLVDAPVDFVAGVYRFRRDPEGYSVQWLDNEELWADPETGLLEVAGVPAGFMCLTRAMLEQMVLAYSDLEYYRSTETGKIGVALFEAWRDAKDPKLKFSEDLSFCARWRALGGRIWIDPEIRMGHVGPKTFTGCIGDWLRNR